MGYDEILVGFSVWCGLHGESRLSRRFPPPDSVHGVLPLPNVKTSWPQQTRCSAVSSGPMIQAVSHGRKRIVVPHCYLLCVNTCSRVAWFRVATSSPARRRIFAYLAFARARAAGSTSSGGSTTQVRTYCSRELVRANCACTRVGHLLTYMVYTYSI